MARLHPLGGSWRIRAARNRDDRGQHAPDAIDPYIAGGLDRQAMTFTHPSPRPAMLRKWEQATRDSGDCAASISTAGRLRAAAGSTDDGVSNIVLPLVGEDLRASTAIRPAAPGRLSTSVPFGRRW
jgi:hypothetical protein